METKFEDINELIATQKKIIQVQDTMIATKDEIITNLNAIIANDEKIIEGLNNIIRVLEVKVKVAENKTAHWSVVSHGYGDNMYVCECSKCKDTVWVYKDANRKWNYCPNCGAKMAEPMESKR